MPDLISRAIVGVVVAASIAALARRAGALTTSGAMAALLLGAVATAAGWSWAVLLVVYFVSTSGLSHWKRGLKQSRTGAVVEKAGARDAWQVFANGGVFGVGAVGFLAWGQPAWLAIAAGALAASAADTWGTEIGTAAGGTPRSLLGWRAVPPGTSGAVSVAGSVATIAGAGFVGALAWGLGWREAFVPAVIGGVAGAFADSLIGATIQQRRWCDTCQEATERSVHGCGSVTRVAGGLAWLDNDVVNLACTIVGAGVAWWVAG